MLMRDSKDHLPFLETSDKNLLITISQEIRRNSVGVPHAVHGHAELYPWKELLKGP